MFFQTATIYEVGRSRVVLAFPYRRLLVDQSSRLKQRHLLEVQNVEDDMYVHLHCGHHLSDRVQIVAK